MLDRVDAFEVNGFDVNWWNEKRPFGMMKGSIGRRICATEVTARSAAFSAWALLGSSKLSSGEEGGIISWRRISREYIRLQSMASFSAHGLGTLYKRGGVCRFVYVADCGAGWTRAALDQA